MEQYVILNHEEIYWIKESIKHELNHKWEDQIFMAERGYGKNYWAHEIDELADILLKLRKSSTF